MKQIRKILRKYFNTRNLVICAMILSTQMSIGQNTDPQKDALVLADTLLGAYGGNPLEAGNQIADIVPKAGSIIDVGLGPSYFDWKDKVYDKIGLKFGVSYNFMYQTASEVVPGAADAAMSDMWGFMMKWTLVNRKKKNKGGIVFSMFERYHIGDYPNPSLFGPANVGSITSAVEWTDWRFTVENLYWEQWINFKKHKLMFRVGNQLAAALIDPFRFKVATINFSTGPFA